MKLLSRSALAASIAVVGLVITVGSGTAYSGYILSNWGDSELSTANDGPNGFLVASPDTNALGIALGGVGAIAALLSGGTLLTRQRWQAQAAAALETEVNPSPTIQIETVLVSEPAEIESEVALAYRR
ncbi:MULTISPECIES: hypothetical protein [Cyanophyceae]|uniref:Uncharacterized protein n=1 Tax=Leptolyngbya subtilissima DQ-A4 TaxID=2933933 RepID=A0ABV0KD36_9CYAN|nr:hypothetical protein [Nodosilinea sp. FACHB-141]MBD2113775.1 hypothetical protein [Nodosilinea sp. FACHB-141]